MSSQYASKKWANGVCDRCGQVYKLKRLLKEIYNQRWTGFLVCQDCWDVDNPQLQLGRWPINDPQALRDPRVDAGRENSRIMWGWNPVSNQATQMTTSIGKILINGQPTNLPPEIGPH